MQRLAGALTTIRFRLGAALALALLPVLLLGAIQVSVAYKKDADEERTNLALAAARSAATARARMEGASVLLETLAPQVIGPLCTERLAEISHRLGGYENLIRFDPAGRNVCSAVPVPADPKRRTTDWFARLALGESSLAVRAPDVFSPTSRRCRRPSASPRPRVISRASSPPSSASRACGPPNPTRPCPPAPRWRWPTRMATC